MMGKLRDLFDKKLDYEVDGQWHDWLYDMLDAIVERLEPADTQRTVVEPCFKVGPTFGVNYADIGGAEDHNDEGMVRNDDWLAECEREWARAYPASWQNKWADRLIAAAKERVDLRAQVAALTKWKEASQ
jgi:hypothetical protein